MEFDHHLNDVSMVLPTDQPYADAILAAGYHFFPHYCAMDGPRLRVFAFALWHDPAHLAWFLVAGPKHFTDTPTFGGVPLLYVGRATPALLMARLLRTLH